MNRLPQGRQPADPTPAASLAMLPLAWALMLALAPEAASAQAGTAHNMSAAAWQDLGALLRPQSRRVALQQREPRLMAALTLRTTDRALPEAAPLPAAPTRAAALVAAAPAPAPALAQPPAATPLRAAVPVAPAPVVQAPVAPVAPAPAPVAVALAAPAPAAIVQAAPAAALIPTLPPTLAPAPQPAQLLAAAPVRPAAAVPVENRFDLSINNAPAAQVFLQLANGSQYNMLVSPDVSGTLSISLKDTTVAEAMDTLRELFGYEYRITGNRIFVYPNTVQTRLYRVNYLPGRRQGASDIRVTSSAITVSGATGGTTTGGGGNTTGGNGSGNRADDNAHVRTTSDADFWREVQNSLAALVGSQGGRSVVLNPAAGVVVVKATPAELRQVENYLKAVQVSIERQVMLEAKIVEVSLSKDAQTGINWGGFGKLGNGQLSIGSAAPGTVLGKTGNLSIAGGTTIAPGVDLAAGALGRGFYGLAFQAANFAALLNFLQTQGDVQVLSSPRIATLNNQKAVLKVGSDELYVTGVTTNTSTNGNNSTSSPSLTLQPFFSGISLDVTPQIDDAGNVMLHVHPTISTVTEKNKNIDLGSLGAFKLPLAASAVNETDSIVRVRDGQIVAIGGLMKQELRDERTGLPVVSEAPVVGGLFRQTGTVVNKRELVIMLKPTIIQEGAAWPDGPTLGGLPAPASTPTR